MVTLSNSSFLDFCAYQYIAPITPASTVEAAYGITDAKPFDGTGRQPFNMAVMLNRVQDPTPLLALSWAGRQQALQQLQSAGTLWSTYGADSATYNQVSSQLQGAGFTLLTVENSNYVSTPEARTIWFTVNDPAAFQALFGVQLYYSEAQDLAYWNGNLTLPDNLAAAVTGLWLDVGTSPNAQNLAPGVAVSLNQGPQSIGNAATQDGNIPPNAIASLYNFPLQAQQFNTGVVGLIEPGVGGYLPDAGDTTEFETRLSTYLSAIGQSTLSGSPVVEVQGASGQTSSQTGERSLDVGVVAAVNPNSPLTLYTGSGQSGSTGHAQATTFTAIQSAIWDQVTNPAVTSNSFGDAMAMTPDSPYYQAYWQLFLDAALRNQTTVIALGDGGSGNEQGNGLSNVEFNVTQPYNLVVGGTSISTLAAALTDPTLSEAAATTPALTSQALAGDLATLWGLIQAGLTQKPSSTTPTNKLLETVWNTYSVNGTRITGSSSEFVSGYLDNSTSSGGVDATQATPSYQQAYGLNPVSNNPSPYAQTGRGVPDVAANAGGNLNYVVPNGNMVGTTNSGGTSAASPLWASLLTQINYIFADQGLPNLGYATDLMYIADVVLPGAFNDITMGNNASSFSVPGPYSTPSAKQVQPTGFGYQASSGYDLVSGLGSPNGTLLAVALTNIARQQQSTAAIPAMLQFTEQGPISSSAQSQALLWQVTSPISTSVNIAVNGAANSVQSPSTSAYAWTSRLAVQSLQKSFDPSLLRMFDGAGQGALQSLTVAADAALAVSIAGDATTMPQAQLSNGFGFSDFVNSSGAVRAARPVCVATTPNNVNNTQALVRLRQNGADAVAVFFYRVDSLTGVIEDVAPGDAGYQAKAQQRLYSFANGGTSLQGAGWGQYSQGLLNGVDSGDLMAMGLTNLSTGRTYWGFSQANEQRNNQGVAHLWNYGMNVFGFEDTLFGGDRDFNDAVFQVDFSSASGTQLLV